jgi:tetratricopeptide (TPR) repeat protein
MKRTDPSRWRFASGILLALLSSAAFAAELKPASEIVAAVQAAAAQEGDQPASGVKKLKDDLDRFTREAGKLAPAEAAARWLQLVEGFWQTPVDQRYLSDFILNSREIIAALPGPSAWPELARLINTRPEKQGPEQMREIALRLMAATLTGDAAAQQKQLEALKALYRKEPQQMRFALHSIQQLNEAMLALSDDPKQIEAMVEARIASSDPRGQLRLPNLVALLGEPAAAALLRKALLASHSSFSVEGKSTKELARKIALESIDQLKSPPWGLVDDLDAVPFYEALAKRFPETQPKAADPDLLTQSDFGGRDYERGRARAIYILGLISQGRVDEAITELEKPAASPVAFFTMVSSLKTQTGDISKFMNQILRKKPELPIWNQYVTVASRAGDSAEMLTLLQETLASGKLSAKSQVQVRNELYRALLAADKVDEAVAEMRRLAEEVKAGAQREADQQLVQLAGDFARIAVALKRPELLQQSIALLRQQLEDLAGNDSFFLTDGIRTVALGLAEFQQLPAAQELVVDALKILNKGGAQKYGMGDLGKVQLLQALAHLYHLNSQPTEVLALLQDAPWWSVSDLGEMPFEGDEHEDLLPIQILAGKALAATGKREQALKIGRSILAQAGGYDPAYELLIQAEPDKAKMIQYLDELFARDRFEERPLIWKAQLLHQQGKREEAEKTVRQAIAIDPSDGEQGPGRRMRAYAVLAAIRKAAGDAKESAFLENVDRSIRLSERADKFNEAHLVSRALEMYKEALGFFADAYCVQSRLALRMSEVGRHAEAEAHYQKAYELMPDSFGRVESHCFGCEAIFGNERAQSAAEKVFSRLVAASPNKPQLHYLLGYLRKEQGRHAEAARHFQDAVKLDPDYLNAWKELQALSGDVSLPRDQRSAIAVNILRLDPLGRHVRSDVSHVTDLAAVWRSVEQGMQMEPPVEKNLLTLAASKSQLEELRRKPGGDAETHSYHYKEPDRTPARVISEHDVLSASAELMEGHPGMF